MGSVHACTPKRPDTFLTINALVFARPPNLAHGWRSASLADERQWIKAVRFPPDRPLPPPPRATTPRPAGASVQVARITLSAASQSLPGTHIDGSSVLAAVPSHRVPRASRADPVNIDGIRTPCVDPDKDASAASPDRPTF